MNLIILTVDALRKETLGCYNKKDGITIGFEEFYKRGLIFESMFTTNTETYPALGSLFTGLYPFNHKVAMEPYDRSKLTLFDYLKDTHSLLLFTEEPPLGESMTNKEYEEYNLKLEGQDGGRTDLRLTPIDVSRLLVYIAKNKNSDFFFTTHFWRPRKYGIHKDNTIKKLITEKKYAQAWKDSLELVEEVGKAIKDIFEHLKLLSLLEKTIVIITADHGDYFASDISTPGFHPLRPEANAPCIKHTELHFNPVINIPFILYYPQLEQKRITQIFSSVDILPTCLDLLGKSLKRPVDGISFAKLLRGEEFSTSRDIFIDRSATAQIYTLVSPNGWKLSTYLASKRLSLYNIYSDPEEKKDLAEERLDIVENLLKKLYSFPIDSPVAKKNIIFRYLNYWNIDYVKKIFDKLEIDDWKNKALYFDKIRWVTDENLLKAFLSIMPENKEAKILEIGIGTGVLSKYIKKSIPVLSITGIDLSPNMLSHIKPEDKITIRTGDAHRLAFPSGYFDTAIMRGVLSYLEDPEEVFREAFRVLKKNGCFLICEEIAQNELFFERWHHIKLLYSVYSQKEISDFFKKAGFQIDLKSEIVIKGHSLNNYFLGYDRLEKRAVKRRYHDAPDNYKATINFLEEKDIRSGMPYGDISVDLKFAIFKGWKE